MVVSGTSKPLAMMVSPTGNQPPPHFEGKPFTMNIIKGLVKELDEHCTEVRQFGSGGEVPRNPVVGVLEL